MVAFHPAPELGMAVAGGIISDRTAEFVDSDRSVDVQKRKRGQGHLRYIGRKSAGDRRPSDRSWIGAEIGVSHEQCKAQLQNQWLGFLSPCAVVSACDTLGTSGMPGLEADERASFPKMVSISPCYCRGRGLICQGSGPNCGRGKFCRPDKVRG